MFSGLNSVPQFVCDGLVPVDPHPRHLLEHALPPEGVQPVDLQLRVPDILQDLRRFIDLLQIVF